MWTKRAIGSKKETELVYASSFAKNLYERFCFVMSIMKYTCILVKKRAYKSRLQRIKQCQKKRVISAPEQDNITSKKLGQYKLCNTETVYQNPVGARNSILNSQRQLRKHLLSFRVDSRDRHEEICSDWHRDQNRVTVYKTVDTTICRAQGIRFKPCICRTNQ